ncbi:DUF1566 domain-containing protein [Vibrio europaeus]|uniref:DUF1566 domain-containing protein n=1 Tax=Vibrio europaeus TaxID=300876 RepID=UPI0018A73EA0|nr:DUF1566 domain-containing protein [Vibrio europaeus]MDC5812160.1 DUF1566 domain-containing protein [Vibrio europaeus]QPG33602.1 DUF1566 domain-containing protein [Vibrio europaeus]
MGVLVKKLGAGAISVALIGCGGGSEPDSKLSPSVEPSASNRLTGVVMDGYLVNANVCLDKNKNSICDSGDGNIVQTDSQGKYELPVEGSTQGYRVLVEAVANKTIDLDNPNQTITKDFTLESPVTHSDVVSPMTSMIVSMAELTGESFDEAARTLAADLNVSEDVLKSDYVSGTSSESQQIHMLARGITRVIQSAQDASKGSGVTEEFARKGSMNRLANLDVAAMKQRTDSLSHGAQNTEQALEQLASDYRDDLKIDHDDIKGDVVTTVPRAPKKGVMDDSADTFDWSLVKPFVSLSDYEYSLDNGISWDKVTEKPISVGKDSKNKGVVQVRVAAKPAKFIAAGKPLKSAKAFTETRVPPAPSNLVVNDAENIFDWQHSAGFEEVGDYEYTVDGGRTWQLVNGKPQKLADVAIAAGELKLRVREDLSSARPTGLSTKSTQPMTVTPASPSAPLLVRANDDSDQFEIQLVTGFDVLKNYEINLGSGWQELTSNPYVVGNVNLDANTIRVRVKANPIDGRPAGAELLITQVFTKVLNKPVAPTLPLIDDANNQFGWTVVAGYEQPNLYELSIDGGQSFQAVTTNPLSIPDNNYNVGKVCVRVKVSSSNAAGSLLCNDKPFTVTPNAPTAPTGGIVDDAANTFDWSWVSGFEIATGYEVSIESGDWIPVASKPITLQDRIYAINSIQVRVKANPVNGRPAGAALSNQSAFTEQPDKPSAPTSLVVDDNANTLDWTNVVGFSELANYEWSADSGSNWAPVIAKPIVVGDIAKSTGTVQLRVRADSQNGMPAGATASNQQPFTETPKLPAPTGGEIKVANNSLAPNMIAWDYVDSGENYNRPEYYEFTVDQGTTWKPVTSNPQFVGSKAYDKSFVGLRIKKNAIVGKSNASGSILWATLLSGQFGALQHVPMKTWNQASGYSLYNGWNSYDTQCIAVYGSQGEGEPTFWMYISESNAEEVFAEVNALNKCGIKHWTLPKKAEVLTLSTRSRDTLPSFARSYLISDYYTVWADEFGKAVAYKNGLKDTSPSYYSKYAFVKWKLAAGSELVADVTSQLSTIDSFISQQSAELNSANNLLSTWVNDNQNMSKTYAQLGSDAHAKLTSLQAFASSWKTKREQLKETLDKLKFEAQIAQSRTDYKSANFIVKVTEYTSKFNQLANNNNALDGFIEAYVFANKLALIQQHAATMTSAKSVLQAASTGSAIHQATMNLYAALYDIEKDYTITDVLDSTLSTALASIDSQYVGLISSINALLNELKSTIALHSVDALYTTAIDGLNRAHNTGYVVSQSDAMIEGSFAKLDLLGRYLPKAATYAQGWRCVLDTRQAGKKRIWTLLQDGLPSGKDEMVYNGQGADIPSLLGAGGRLESVNSSRMCGYSDWVVPHPSQLETLATATVSGLQGAGTTVDVNVFPNHKALLAEYDKSHYSGGTRFYYWSNAARSSSRQYAYVFASKSESPGTRIFEVDGDTYDQYITVARLMREDPVAWEYLAQNGAVVTERSAALCARDPDTGYVWQLFQSTNADERYKSYRDVQSEITRLNAGTCGLKNWALPTQGELKALIPVNAAVFPYASPSDTNYSHHEKYLTSGATSSRYEAIEVQLGESSSGYSGSSYEYLYRLVAK